MSKRSPKAGKTRTGRSKPRPKSLRRQGAAKRKGPGVLYFSAIIIATLVFSLAYVHLRSLRTELAYELSRNQSREAELDKERRRLLYALARLKDSERLEKVAKEQFGLRAPTPGQVVVLDSEGSWSEQ